VCPRIERRGNTRTPRFFQSEAGAKRFLNSEVQYPLQPEADASGLSVEAVRTRRKDRKAEQRKERMEAAHKIKTGELHPLAYPTAFRRIRNRDQGWDDPVPIRRWADYSGAGCKRRLRDFLPIDAVGPLPAFNFDEELERALDGRFGDYTCYLDEDWGFNGIEADAWRRVGHEYSGRRHAGIGEIVVRAVHDLEGALERSHPAVPSAAVGDFWRSWQVQLHIADFCARLADSETARLLAGTGSDAADQAERARVHVYRQLAAFAHELLEGVTPALKPSAVTPAASNASGFTPEDWEFARLAIDEARQSVPEDRSRPHPKVGAVVVGGGKVLAAAHRGEFPGNHAEYITLERKLADTSLVDTTVYTTLEPCTERNHPKVPCAQRLVERKVKRVVIGMLDPNPAIRGRGQQILRDANIITDLFPHDLMSQVEELNRDFVRLHKAANAGMSASRWPAPSSATPAPISVPKGQNDEDRNSGVEADRRTLDDLLEVLPSGGAIRFLRTNNFAGFPFEWEQLKDLDRFHHERSGPDHEFIDPEIESLRLDLRVKCNSLTRYLGLNTWYHPAPGGGSYASVPGEWESEQPERFKRTVETIHAQAQNVCDAYDQLVRTARRKLLG
jgi:pyrimidine deaminase RibD-like protein